eukprot:CAMPEP_0119380304 /NCGR_PEP_ID=MMETSP1334-20130426/56307_1 /TAXON_ID=127549 /ORGANISM="Calcidiscus leptoporus, Strain RCC1130" /LENGTH=426 /DNA_ID=CAMNT_0007400071 /DNA_START=136 /DNA_END=1416 /DNA_ORIENTATION=-
MQKFLRGKGGRGGSRRHAGVEGVCQQERSADWSPSSSYGRRLLLLGVMTSPTNFNARSWQRRAYSTMSSPDVAVRFVIGNTSRCRFERSDTEPKWLLREEMLRQPDMLSVRAPDCVKQAVATKTLAWYRAAALMEPASSWVGKCDDDTLVDLHKLRLDALLMEAVGRACGQPVLYAYHGIMRWRLWRPASSASESAHHVERRFERRPKPLCDAEAEVGCACGMQTDSWPPTTQRFLSRLVLEATSGKCPGAFGPFPFVEGSLHMLSLPLVKLALADAEVADFASAQNWTHEDVGLAFVLLRASLKRSIPMMYFALNTWMHNMRWLDLRPEGFPRLPDEHVLSVHRVTNARHAELAVEAFAALNRTREFGYTCHACSDWGWNQSYLARFGKLRSWGFGCCQRQPSVRLPREKRRIDAHLPRALSLGR